jgi:hypothetical protein
MHGRQVRFYIFVSSGRDGGPDMEWRDGHT